MLFAVLGAIGIDGLMNRLGGVVGLLGGVHCVYSAYARLRDEIA
ncbi:MAG: hypothetical protein AAGJ46_06100 [Planctomycetota bacterium]